MSTFRKVNNWLHLWLGLISGVIVLIVCITGCIWVFNEEITSLLEPENNVPIENKAVMLPSELMRIAAKENPGLKVSYANYHQGKAINVGMGERRGPNITLKVHPYTGEVLGKEVHKKGETNFFRFILNGHRFLWMPFEIGRPIVNYGTMVFVVLLITGLVWWYPKKWNQSTRDKSFKIKWGASFKRVNLDLHNVLGFYSLLFLLAIALTGMVYGIQWYSEGLYWVTSGGKSLANRREIVSDSLKLGSQFTPQQAIDGAWLKVAAANPKSEGFYYSFPDTSRAKSTIYMTVYPRASQFYNARSYIFDQHTLRQLTDKDDVYAAEFGGASFGTKLRKMNYDIHVGSILGFPGKVLAFLASLIGASLPVTGFIIWWNRKGFGTKKGKKKGTSKTTASPASGPKPGAPAKPVFRPKTPQREIPYGVSVSENTSPEA